jgi:hypothetical protein
LTRMRASLDMKLSETWSISTWWSRVQLSRPPNSYKLRTILQIALRLSDHVGLPLVLPVSFCWSLAWLTLWPLRWGSTFLRKVSGPLPVYKVFWISEGSTHHIQIVWHSISFCAPSAFSFQFVPISYLPFEHHLSWSVDPIWTLVVFLIVLCSEHFGF